MGALHEILYHALAICHRGPKSDPNISIRDNVSSLIAKFQEVFMNLKKLLGDLFAKSRTLKVENSS